MPNFNSEQITDYLAGEFPASSHAEWEQWLAANPEEQTRVAQWSGLWQAMQRRERFAGEADVISRAVAMHVANRARGSAEEFVPSPSRSPVRGQSRRWFGITLLVLLAIIPTFALQYGDRITRSHGTQVLTYATARGHHQTVSLSDGTQVAMAPDTKMRVQMSDNGARTVELDGEAVFTVAPDKQQPFVVRTSTTTVRVLGTVFSVRQYGGDPLTYVAVRSGKVAMNTIALSAGDMGQTAADGSAQVQHHANLNLAFGWIDGALVFEETPLSEIAAQLSRWYDVDVVLADPSLSHLPFTFTTRHESLDMVMKSIARAANVRVVQQGSVITISPFYQRSTE